MEMTFKGNAIKIPGIHINADTAMGWYVGIDTLPASEIAKQFMCGVDTEIVNRVKAGDILVCDRNFGYGKTHPPIFTAMKELGIKCIVAKSFATQFIDSALNMNAGIMLVQCEDAFNLINDGDEIEVDVEKAIVKDYSSDALIQGTPFPPFTLNLMKCSGYLGYLMMRQTMKEKK